MTSTTSLPHLDNWLENLRSGQVQRRAKPLIDYLRFKSQWKKVLKSNDDYYLQSIYNCKFKIGEDFPQVLNFCYKDFRTALSTLSSEKTIFKTISFKIQIYCYVQTIVKVIFWQTFGTPVQTPGDFTISSFGGLDASLLPANAASRVTETQNLISLCSLCYVTCC